MNQELVMMFNGVEANQIPSTQEVSADGMMAAFYNEIQQNMQQTIPDVTQSMEIVQDGITYKNIDCSVLDSGNMAQSVTATESSANDGSTLKFINEDNTFEADQSNIKVKTIEIPDSWKIAILESNGVSSHAAEPLVESDNQGYQLWECPICTALFREKEICEQHVSRSHDFTCGLCSEPFQEKEALENHVIRHISEIPGHALQKISFEDSLQVINSNSHETLASTGPSFSDSKPNSVFSCSECSLTFSSAQDLAKHRECHMDDDDDDELFNAQGKMHEDQYSVKAVAESSSKGPRGKFTCDVCNQKCFSKNALLLHMTKRHAALVNKNYICDDCGESFKWKLSLQNHQIVEHGRRKQNF